MNPKATRAFEAAQLGVETPQIEYATRRIGGPEYLSGNLAAFTQAYNESPIVDADEDTPRDETLVRPLEPKDGIS